MLNRIICFLLFIFLLPSTTPLFGQQVTISMQPGSTFVATFGAPLAKVAVYRGLVCSAPGASVSASWGSVEQIAEAGGISVVDNVLVGPSAQKAEGKTTLHRWVVGLSYVGLATVSIAVFKSPPAWLIETGAGIAGVGTIFDKQLTGSEAQVQQTIQAALSALMDPSAQFSVSNGACVTSKIFMGSYVPNFKPIVASLGSMVVPASGPASTVPIPNILTITPTKSENMPPGSPVLTPNVEVNNSTFAYSGTFASLLSSESVAQ